MKKPRLGQRAKIALIAVGIIALAAAALRIAFVSTSPSPPRPSSVSSIGRVLTPQTS